MSKSHVSKVQNAVRKANDDAVMIPRKTLTELHARLTSAQEYVVKAPTREIPLRGVYGAAAAIEAMRAIQNVRESIVEMLRGEQ